MSDWEVQAARNGERLAALAQPFLGGHGASGDLYRLLHDAPERLRRPTRLAVAGKIKVGKSTLVNAILQRDLAVTDELEATYRVNEFRRGDKEEIWAHYPSGPGGNFEPRRFPLSDLGRLTVRDAARTSELAQPSRIVVRVREEPPRDPVLRDLILIDTPGLQSVYGSDSDDTTRLLTRRSGDVLNEADAVLYVFQRDIGDEDLAVVRKFLGPQSSTWQANAAKALGVLSQCDFGWSPPTRDDPLRNDPMAAKTALIRKWWEAEPELRRTFYEILPVAAKVAERAQLLSAEDLADLRDLGRWDQDKLPAALRYRENAFRARVTDCPVPWERWATLRAQLGVWGLMQATRYMNDGCDDATVVTRLVEVSGVPRVRELIRSLYGQQRYVIKTTGLLDALRAKITEQQAALPAPEIHLACERVRDAVEDIADRLPGLTEMQIARLIRQDRVNLGQPDIDNLSRLVAVQRALSDRLGVLLGADVTEDSALSALFEAALAEARHWSDCLFTVLDPDTKEAVEGARKIAEGLAGRLQRAMRLRAEAAELLRRAAELTGPMRGNGARR